MEMFQRSVSRCSFIFKTVKIDFFFVSLQFNLKNLTNYVEEHRRLEALHHFIDVQLVSVIGQKETYKALNFTSLTAYLSAKTH